MIEGSKNGPSNGGRRVERISAGRGGSASGAVSLSILGALLRRLFQSRLP